MVMDVLLGLLGSTIPGVRPCRSGAAAAQQPPFTLLMCIPGRKAEHGWEMLPTPNLWAAESCFVQAHAWEIKNKGGAGERGQEDAVSRSAGAVPHATWAVLSVG